MFVCLFVKSEECYSTQTGRKDHIFWLLRSPLRRSIGHEEEIHQDVGLRGASAAQRARWIKRMNVIRVTSFRRGVTKCRYPFSRKYSAWS